jgi:hypothetical protein
MAKFFFAVGMAWAVTVSGAITGFVVISVGAECISKCKIPAVVQQPNFRNVRAQTAALSCRYSPPEGCTRNAQRTCSRVPGTDPHPY